MADPSLRRSVGILVGLAAHVERNIPQIFPEATTNRLEDAADELLSGHEPLSFETRVVVVRIAEAVMLSKVTRPWAMTLRVELELYLAELGP